MKILSSSWFVALVGSLAYLGTTLFCFSIAKLGTIHPTAVAEEDHAILTESWGFKNPELDQMIVELKQEKEALSLRAQQLKELEARLASERQEIKAVTDAVSRLQRELDQSVLRIKQEEIPNLKKLAKVHAAMSAEGSANILKEETDEEILKVLFYLKPTETGPIVEAFGKLGKAEAQRAAQLTERLRRTTENPPEKAKP
ncbi:MAG TPA: hypothetical protein VK846_10430 [Candidatus Limnocylindria bacterium]|nr:hypothetical protein [Candidatus Limnocylindria bacterium]